MSVAPARSAVLTVAGLGLTAALCLAQAPGFKRTEVQKGDLSAPGREAVQAVAEFQPNAESGKHTHPGEEIAYVLEGSLNVEIDGMGAKTFKAGQGFIVPAGRPHNAKNIGNGVAKVLGTYIVEKGKPLATPVK
jgi:quercetin dioxygenase-like cupin family protein